MKDPTYIILLGGPPEVGKTNIRYRITGKNFVDNYVRTIGAEFESVTKTIDGKMRKCQIWDIDGNEKDLSLTSAVFFNTPCLVFVFDLSKPKTFESQKKWIEIAQAQMKPGAQIYIVGNKKDLLGESAMDSNAEVEIKKIITQIYQIAGENNYFEVSAKTGEGIDKLLSKIVRDQQPELQLSLSIQDDLNLLNSKSTSILKFDPNDATFADDRKAGLIAYLGYRNAYHSQHPIIDALRTGLSFFKKGYRWKDKIQAVDRLLNNKPALEEDAEILKDGKLGQFLARFDN